MLVVGVEAHQMILAALVEAVAVIVVGQAAVFLLGAEVEEVVGNAALGLVLVDIVVTFPWEEWVHYQMNLEHYVPTKVVVFEYSLEAVHVAERHYPTVARQKKIAQEALQQEVAHLFFLPSLNHVVAEEDLLPHLALLKPVVEAEALAYLLLVVVVVVGLQLFYLALQWAGEGHQTSSCSVVEEVGHWEALHHASSYCWGQVGEHLVVQVDVASLT